MLFRKIKIECNKLNEGELNALMLHVAKEQNLEFHIHDDDCIEYCASDGIPKIILCTWKQLKEIDQEYKISVKQMGFTERKSLCKYEDPKEDPSEEFFTSV